MLICGIDEAGRGPLAGPVVIAAVVINPNIIIDGIKDSKKLNEKQRESLYNPIIESCLDCTVEIVDNIIIDKINILQATMLGMEKCIDKLLVKPDIFLVDGNYFKLAGDKQFNINYKTIVKGDDKVYQISCASIIAKVTRDRIMSDYDVLYPQYGFSRNKGYGTKEHIESIKLNGICEVHRRSFVKKYLI